MLPDAEDVAGKVTGVRKPELPVVDVFAGAEGMEVMLPEVPDVLEVELVVNDELER